MPKLSAFEGVHDCLLAVVTQANAHMGQCLFRSCKSSAVGAQDQLRACLVIIPEEHPYLALHRQGTPLMTAKNCILNSGVAGELSK